MNERIRDRIAANMSYYRKKAKMTQTEVAEQIHSKKNTISMAFPALILIRW